MADRQYLKPVVLLGEGGVGKTSLMRRYVADTFDERYLQTLGMNVSTRHETFPTSSGDVRLTLQIRDLHGQRGNPHIDALVKGDYMRQASGAILVCDATRLSQTLDALVDWLELLFGAPDIAPDTPLVFLVNKSDQVQHPDRFEAYATFNIRTWLKGRENWRVVRYSSAKTGANVADAFKALGRQILIKSGVTGL